MLSFLSVIRVWRRQLSYWSECSSLNPNKHIGRRFAVMEHLLPWKQSCKSYLFQTALDSLVLCLCSSFSTWCMKYKFRHTEWSFSTWLYSQQFCCTLTTKCEPNLQFEIALKQWIEYEFSRITLLRTPPSFITVTDISQLRSTRTHLRLSRKRIFLAFIL